MGITDEIAAWCLDRAVFLFGTELEDELRRAGEGARNAALATAAQQRVLAAWLGTRVQYKDPSSPSGGGVSSRQGTGTVSL